MLTLRDKYYILNRNVLLFVRQNHVDTDYWDNIWNESDLRTLHACQRTGFLVRLLSHYLPSGRAVLEAGCGDGRIVLQLTNQGYHATGIDFAPKIIDKLNALFPELPIFQRDVRQTGFDSESFDGYVSIGVIEHFTDTFEPVLREAHRILKPGGHAFVTFPYMSPLRRWKARLGFYEQRSSLDEYCVEHFNQFALRKQDVIHTARGLGFRHVKSVTYNGILGWCEEIAFLRFFMRSVYDSKNKYVRVLRAIVNRVLAPIMSHSIILIFRRG